jgi:hypothetical protein
MILLKRWEAHQNGLEGPRECRIEHGGTAAMLGYHLQRDGVLNNVLPLC